MTNVPSSDPSLEARIAADPHRFRVLTGDRPTGALHLGHYFGTLANRVRLQDHGVQTYLVVADYQVITDRDLAGDLPGNVHEMLLDQLAAGIDPERATIFTHSAVPALNQLLLPLLSLISVAELQRNPTVKAEAAASGTRAMSGLLLTYPVHQAADILFCSAHVVPVGRDQLAHLEVARTLARRFNDRYGRVFTVPDPLVGDAPVLLGIDGTKMSKSRGNAIELRATADRTAALIRRARTDGVRRVTYEPATRPEVANLLELAGLCLGEEPEDLADRIGDRGAAGLKALVTDAVNDHFAPLRRRRAELAADAAAGGLDEILARGNDHATLIAEAKLDEVRAAMNMSYRRSAPAQKAECSTSESAKKSRIRPTARSASNAVHVKTTTARKRRSDHT
ncbi:tryptophan--tRNA ligase [Actinomycetospora endophytica]|uniref:Tryptophan--tRNA ligase n=1 Tax=Actinomycetospora endophytica TaxID=2291215 RepID=A0ABS8P581_9PSEU|nr:tryptophan--tRNA ligase [Actinomycetospora endophytica]MCD2193087.1 tryptophan--tRNA ligase [Actinomycetospora endophytica]